MQFSHPIAYTYSLCLPRSSVLIPIANRRPVNPASPVQNKKRPHSRCLAGRLLQSAVKDDMQRILLFNTPPHVQVQIYSCRPEYNEASMCAQVVCCTRASISMPRMQCWAGHPGRCHAVRMYNIFCIFIEASSCFACVAQDQSLEPSASLQSHRYQSQLVLASNVV